MKRKVSMRFLHRITGWCCTFVEEDLKTPIGEGLRFASEHKVLELAERGGAFKQLADRQAVDHGIREGKGGLWLNLTDEQYRKLK